MATIRSLANWPMCSGWRWLALVPTLLGACSGAPPMPDPPASHPACPAAAAAPLPPPSDALAMPADARDRSR